MKKEDAVEMTQSEFAAGLNYPGLTVEDVQRSVDRMRCINTDTISKLAAAEALGQKLGSPAHYGGNWEIGRFIYRQGLCFYAGNVVKYICRYKKKNGLDDLKKARNYLDQLINEIECK